MARKQRKAVTLQDLSEQLGISTFTISKALSGREGMSEETRERIIAAARSAGYRWKAEPRRSESSRALAVVIPSRFLGEFSYFADLLQGAEAAARQAGCVMTVVGISAEDQVSSLLPPAISGAAGAIYLPMLSEAWMKQAIEFGPPAVAINFAHRTWAVDSVVWDAQSGVGLCVDHLVQSGHHRIGYVGAPDVAPGYRLRWLGYLEALREHGLTADPADHLFPEAWPPELCLESVTRLLKERAANLPTALVCDFETTAVAVVRALSELGQPQVEVVCADQPSAATLLAAPLTHIHYHRDQVGRRAVERLLRRLEAPEEPHEQIRVAVALRVR